MIDRQAAWELLNQYTSNVNLIRHALAVEAAMKAYADRFGEDPELWSVAGLIHDFDYERFPEKHPQKGAAILKEAGYPEEIVEAVLAHADHTGVPRRTRLAKALYAVDELCGFITAATLVRPGKRVADLPVRSVKKRMKDKAFARAVDRDAIRRGAEELGVELDEHIGVVVGAMAGIADQLGLDGGEA
ncbi:MAG TPA: HDIG domain-containing protein [Acidobacteriota bacterium]|jgi:putative nucleotidyltransferase with HDIG domain|nr:HDIG domain-containing protein [Acidobacteriota bacterium]HRV08387.1 HDIG domain-containing protein [Acidobacteriota bacterium]